MSDSRAIRIHKSDSAKLARGFRSDSSATTSPLYNIKVSGRADGDLSALTVAGDGDLSALTVAGESASLEFYHAWLLQRQTRKT